MGRRISRVAGAVVGAAALLPGVLYIAPAQAAGASRTYTVDADFDEGSSINVVHSTADQLQLDDTTEPFGFIWIAASGRGTAVKIDTVSGEILGEYLTSPTGMQRNPSRTTVDKDGNVWVTNRDESGFVAADAIAPGVPPANTNMGSVVHFGLAENGQCIDRNGNGMIDTSTGLGDIRPWPNAGAVDNLGGVSTATDECVLHYARVNSYGARHVSVDENNDVWVSGTGGQRFDLLDGDTGQIIRQEASVGFGGYGGLIDPNGVIWSARPLLHWDTALPLSGPNGGNWKGYFHDSYGLCIGPDGNVWNTELGSQIRRFAPDGTLLFTGPHGGSNAQGCAIDKQGHVWIAHSLFSATTVGHLAPDGTWLGNVTLPGGNGPTGVAVDRDGKVWSANINSNNASRIDPTQGSLGNDGVTPVGAVDLTVDLGAGASPYNYSDMTGSTLIGAPDNGSWTVVYDSGIPGATWGTISRTADVPGDAELRIFAASSADGITFGPEEAVTPGQDLASADGQYLRVRVEFQRSSSGESPVLYDLTVSTADYVPPEPECDEDGLDALHGSPADGVASGVVHGTVEPLAGGVDEGLAEVVHDPVNCGIVVPVEDAVDGVLGTKD